MLSPEEIKELQANKKLGAEIGLKLYREKFNFDLERMKLAVSCPTHIMPDNLNFNGFQSLVKENDKQ